MNRHVGVVGALLLGLLGCAHQQTRLQAPDEADKEADVVTIGQWTTFANADPIHISGVGLVVGLEGTGGNPPEGSFLNLLLAQLRKDRVEHIKEILASPDTSLVLVSAMIPPGARKGDPIDVEISLPPHSKTTSLRGGYLKETVLFNYDTKKNLDPNYQGANSTLLGHVLAKTEGPLLVGFGDGDEASRLKLGRIWGGGRSMVDRPFYLVFNNDQQRIPVVKTVADRINETFHGSYRGALGDIAIAKTNSYLVLGVPQQYKLNLPRFLRVVRLIPIPENVQPSYRRRLEEQLLDPAHAITTALRLEALGSDSIETLKQGLQSAHPLVRFASAEALAYLGCPKCGEELANLVEHQPLLRAYCLTAMASLDEAINHVKLRDLMATKTPVTRYGAFRALRALDEHDAGVQGELLNHSFWLHRAAAESEPLVHLSTSRRAEIVLFGEDPTLVPPFAFLAGEFTITAARGDDHCTLSRMSARHGSQRGQSSLKLEDVLRTLAGMGGMYPEAVELLHQAGSYQCLNCQVAVDALPQAPSINELAQSASGNPDFLKADEEFLNAKEEFGATPTLYDKSNGARFQMGRHLDGAIPIAEHASAEDNAAEAKSKRSR